MLRAVPEGGLLDGTAEFAHTGKLTEIAEAAAELVFGSGTADREESN
jgi:hypothetical protein